MRTRFLSRSSLVIVLASSGCTKEAEPRNPLPTLPVPTTAAAMMSHDSVVTLYYSPKECFTCYGVLGHWAAVAYTSEVIVRLSLDSQPDEKTRQAIKRMRLPFELGITPRNDRHSRRSTGTMKEVLSVGGRVVDSAIVRQGETSSPLLDQLKAAK